MNMEKSNVNNLNGVSNFGHGEPEEVKEETVVVNPEPVESSTDAVLESTESVETVDESVEVVDTVSEETSEEAPGEPKEESTESEI